MSDVENAYEALAEASDDTRWAFGTGFADPLAGIDTSVPSDVDGSELAAYCLMLGDDALIMSHRLQEWCTNAPELEDEVAIANIGLDLLGQARLLLARAGKADGTDRGEDDFAYFRDSEQFRSVRLAEVVDSDFACMCARLLIFSTWRLAVFSRLVDSCDPVLAAIAAKGVKELTYHRDYSAQWVLRLGDGTEYSHERMRSAMDWVWPLVDELFATHDVERRMAECGAGIDPASVRAEFDSVLEEVLTKAALSLPQAPPMAGVSGRTGRDGVHTEVFGFLLAELQSLARAHPEATW